MTYPEIVIFGTKTAQLRAKYKEDERFLSREVTIGGAAWNKMPEGPLKAKILWRAEVYLNQLIHNLRAS